MKKRLFKNLGKVANIISAILMVASVVTNFVPLQLAGAANSGAIWTTASNCGTPGVDLNHFAIGDHIYIHGSGFDANTSYAWAITGKPGGASGDPNIDVASGNILTDSNGDFCFDAYTVQPDDWGEYGTKVGNKGDNYQVDGVTPAPALSIVKTADPTTYSQVGDEISYSYLVTNTGNVTINGPITVADDKATVTCPAGNLASNAFMTCTATYIITQDDLDNGSVINTAHACGIYVTAPVCSTEDQETVTAVQNLSISLDKSADPTTYILVGDEITYTYVITNTGNVTLSGPFTVDDDKATVTCDAVPLGGLLPGGTLNCTATYTITQDDIDNGSVTNIAVAHGNDLTSNEDQETVTDIPRVGIHLTKVASPTTYDHVGQEITYTYTILNAGTTTLSGPFTVTDDKATVTCPAGGLAPLATMDCTATYIITQEDLDNGYVTNTAVAHGNQLDSNEAFATVYGEVNPSLSITKSATPPTYAQVGDVVNYSYDVTNTGNITLSNITVTDDKTTVTCPAGDLTPGDTITCTATYVITQADLDNWTVTNTAYAEGEYGDGQSVQSNEAQATVRRFEALLLSALCAADPTLNNAWVVTNNNIYDVDYEITNGDGTFSFAAGTPVSGNSTASFETPMSAGSTMKLFVGGVLQDTAPAAVGCLPGNFVPGIPVTGVTAPASGGEVLIPVTGVDLGALSHSLPGDLFSLSLGFFGLGLVFAGLSRKQEDKE
jgi:uncharacterized repeat protein (TIGR01451 family)